MQSGTKTLYDYHGDWFEWEGEVNCVPTPIPGDPNDRVYITGDGGPKMTHKEIAVSGDGPYPSATVPLGVASPASPVGVTVETPDITKGAGATFLAAIHNKSDQSHISAGDHGNFAVLHPDIDFFDYYTYDGYLDIVVTDGGCDYPETVKGKISIADGMAYEVDMVVEDGAIKGAFLAENVEMAADTTHGVVVLDMDTVKHFDDRTTTSRVYTYTYVSALGEEGPPATPSEVVDVLQDDYEQDGVDLSSTVDLILSAPPADVSKIRIYRYAQGASSGDFFFVAEVPAEDAPCVYSDTIRDMDLPGGLLETTDFDTPPDDLLGLISLPNGVMAGFAGREICFSEPFLPYAWPVKYRLTVEHNVVALAPMGNGLVVLTVSQPYLVGGNHPGSMSMEMLDVDQACVSSLSIASDGGSVVFASPDGLMLVTTQGTINITKEILTREQWLTYNPASLIGAYHNERYYGFYTASSGDSGSFIIDPNNPKATFSLTTVIAEAVFKNRLSDGLYIKKDTTLSVWGEEVYGDIVTPTGEVETTGAMDVRTRIREHYIAHVHDPDKDPDGVNYWVENVVADGFTVEQVLLMIDSIIATGKADGSIFEDSSGEWWGIADGLQADLSDPEQIIKDYYDQWIHDHTTDPEGVAYWVAHLDEGWGILTVLQTIQRAVEEGQA